MKRYFGAHEETCTFKASSSRQIADVRYPSVLRRLAPHSTSIFTDSFVSNSFISYHSILCSYFHHMLPFGLVSVVRSAFRYETTKSKKKILIGYEISINLFIINCFYYHQISYPVPRQYYLSRHLPKTEKATCDLVTCTYFTPGLFPSSNFQ